MTRSLRVMNGRIATANVDVENEGKERSIRPVVQELDCISLNSIRPIVKIP
jgi:hypothetical protein